MDAVERIAYGTVLMPVAAYNVKQRAALAMRDITERDRLLFLRYVTVKTLEQRYELADERLALAVNLLALCSHLLLPKPEKVGVRLVFRPQQ